MNKQTLVFVVAALLFVALLSGCNSGTAMLEANKEIVGRFSDALNNQNFAALDDLMTKDFIRHSQATAEMQVKSREQFIELQKGYISAFPDQKVTMQRMIAEGDYVAVVATYSGTQEGPMPPFPATGNKVKSTFLALFRMQEGKIAEMWVEWDNVAILTQLGLFPPQPMTAK